jgi:hypothetical protein
MSLPACQQRVLDRMEGLLQASEPHLVSMFAIFARLNADQPVCAEPLARSRRRRRWSPPATAAYAVVLIPILFVMTVVGALLSANGSSAKACEVGYSVGGGSPLVNQPSCQTVGKAAVMKASIGKESAGKTSAGSDGAPCIAAALTARPAVWTGSEQAFSLPAGTNTAGWGTPQVCYK